MTTETFAEAFKMGFQAAGKWFDYGLTVEEITKQARDLHTIEYQAGVMAWTDLWTGWIATPHVRMAKRLGLKISLETKCTH